MKIIHVIPLKKGIWKDDLTYFTSLDTPAGSIVSVPVRSKNTLALVTSVEDLSLEKSNVKNMDFNLRKVTESKGNSIFLKEYLEAVFETGKYFIQNKNISISSLIPVIFIEEYDKIMKIALDKNTENNQNTKPAINLKTEKSLFQYPLEERISIYKTLIRESFAKGKSMFIVVPTELYADKFTQSLTKGIEQFTFTMHSGISPKKILQTYGHIVNATHPVLVIGTTPFLSIPQKNLGTIIIENESSNAYKMITRPYFDMRTFVEIFASKLNVKLVLADDLLRFETIERMERDNFNTLYPLSFRIKNTVEIKVISKNKENENSEENKKFKILEDASIEEIKKTIQNKKNVFVFTLRKGLATMTVCRDCGETIMCDKCGSTLVLYTSQNGEKKIFVCNKCGNEKDANTKCSSCESWNLIPLGIGTDTVYEHLKELLPKNKIFKLDKESAKSKTGAKKIIEEFESTHSAILVGTEMALMYMQEKVPLTVISSFDSLWSIPNFKMGEKILRILLQIIEKTNEKFIIQTKNDKDEIVATVMKENILSFVRSELEDRKNLNYPPFKRFIKVVYTGDKEETKRTREILKDLFSEYNPEIFSGFIPKMKGKYATNMLIKIAPEKWNAGNVIDEKLSTKLSSLPPSFQTFVDPEDLL